MGLIIIVDTSDSSIENNIIVGTRENILYVEKFSIKEIEKMNEYSMVLNRLKYLKRMNLVEKFIGGKPLFFKKLLKYGIVQQYEDKPNTDEINKNQKHIKYIEDSIGNEYTESVNRFEEMIIKNEHKQEELIAFIEEFKKQKNDKYYANKRKIGFISKLESSCFRIITKEKTYVVPITNSVDCIVKNYPKSLESDFWEKHIEDLSKQEFNEVENILPESEKNENMIVTKNEVNEALESINNSKKH